MELSLKNFREFLEIAQEMGDVGGVAAASADLGNLYLVQKNWEKSHNCFLIQQKISKKVQK